MARNFETMPLDPMTRSCAPTCPPGSKTATILPIVSVRSVNGESGDIVLKKLTIGEKNYNGSNDVEVFASDLGLGKALVYEKTIATTAKVIEAMADAKAGDLYFCNEDGLFYLSVGEGDYKAFASDMLISNYSKIVNTTSKIVFEVNAETFELTAKLYDLKDGLVFESEPILLPMGMKDAIKSGHFDATTGDLVFILQNDTEVRVPISGLIDNLQKKITQDNKLAFDLVDGLTDFKVKSEEDLAAEVEARKQAVAQETTERATAIAQEKLAREQADATEKAAREAADQSLQEKLDAEIQRSTEADAKLTYDLNQEVDQRKYAFDLLKQQIQEEAEERIKVDVKVIQEITDRKQGDADLLAALRSEITTRESADTALRNDLSAETTARIDADNVLTKGLNDEVAARKLRDIELTDLIDAEKSARESNDLLLQQAIYNETSARTEADTKEAAERRQGDADLLTALHNESNAREAADNVLQQHIDQEAQASLDRDTILQYHIDQEAATRNQADADLLTALRNEISARESHDNELQEQIYDVPKYGIIKDTDPGIYAAVYHLTSQVREGEIVNVGTPIAIPKDFLVKSAELKTVVKDNVPYEGAKVGDKYIDFVINTKETPTPAQETHIYLPVNDLVDIYTGGDGINIVNNVISIKPEILTEVAALRTDLGTERTERQNADEGLRTDLNDLGVNVENHVNNKNNPHNVTKAQVGLGNVDNTADLDKPISNAQQAALNQEITDRQTADTNLNNTLTAKIEAEENARKAAISAEEVARNAAIVTESAARVAGDNALESHIITTKQLITVEETARIAADQYLQDQITAINAKKDHFAGVITCDGTSTVYTLNHGLNTYDVIVQMYDLGNYNTVITDTCRTDANTLTFTFKEAPTAGKKYKVLCYGISDIIITINPNGGTGSQGPLSATKGIPYIMPSCSLVAPEGQVFDKWAISSTEGTKVAAGVPYTFTADTEIFAIWKEKPVVPNIYYGAVETVPPTDTSELTGEFVERATLLADGYTKTITIGPDEWKHETYAVIKSLGLTISKFELYALGAWNDVTDEFTAVETATDIIYYHNNLVNDCDAEYRLTFEGAE